MKAGPQPSNQIAGTLEAQLARVCGTIENRAASIETPTEVAPMSDDDSAESEVYDIVKIEQETDKAFLLLFDGGDKRWVPKSVIENAEDYHKNEENVEMRIAAWFCDKIRSE